MATRHLLSELNKKIYKRKYERTTTPKNKNIKCKEEKNCIFLLQID